MLAGSLGCEAGGWKAGGCSGQEAGNLEIEDGKLGSWRLGGPSSAILEASWAILGLSWTILGLSWPILEPSWLILGPLQPILEPSWLILGLSWAILAHLGGILACLGAILANFRLHFGAQNCSKTFPKIDYFLDRFWAPFWSTFGAFWGVRVGPGSAQEAPRWAQEGHQEL